MNPLIAWRTLCETNAPADKIARRQRERLCSLVKHAATTVPFWRERFASLGIEAGDIRCAADLAALPVVEREEFQATAVEARIPNNVDAASLAAFATSGSTGHPVQIRAMRSDHEINDALVLRAMWKYGMRPGHRKSNTRSVSRKERDTALAARLGLFKRQWLFVPDGPEGWVRDLLKFRPNSIMTLRSTLYTLGTYILDHGIEEIRPDFVISTSESLTDDVRELVARAFCAPVRDLYASWESGIIAWECPECDGYHINSDWAIVEIVDERGAAVPRGTEGDVVITNLHSYGMPFIRYGQGDRAVLSADEPTCGCSLPLMKRICGRTTDLLVGAGGRRVSAHAFLTTVAKVGGLKRWRLIQETRTRLVLEAEVDTRPDEADVELVRRRFCELLGVNVALLLRVVEKMEMEPGQKFHRVICRVESGT